MAEVRAILKHAPPQPVSAPDAETTGPQALGADAESGGVGGVAQLVNPQKRAAGRCVLHLRIGRSGTAWR